MDFEHLLRPYTASENVGDPDRTVQRQLDWLVNRKGFELGIAQLAMAKVYFEISGGLKFEGDVNHKAGHYLDIYLLNTAVELRGAGLDAMVKAAGDKLEQMINTAIVENRKPGSIQLADPPKKVPWWKLF